jgi:hypothetical protein
MFTQILHLHVHCLIKTPRVPAFCAAGDGVVVAAQRGSSKA